MNKFKTEDGTWNRSRISEYAYRRMRHADEDLSSAMKAAWDRAKSLEDELEVVYEVEEMYPGRDQKTVTRSIKRHELNVPREAAIERLLDMVDTEDWRTAEIRVDGDRVAVYRVHGDEWRSAAGEGRFATPPPTSPTPRPRPSTTTDPSESEEKAERPPLRPDDALPRPNTSSGLDTGGNEEKETPPTRPRP